MIDWLVHYASEITNIGNGVWIAMSVLVSYYMLGLWKRSNHPAVQDFSLGVLLVAISSGIHRTWWFLGIATAEAGQPYALWATDYRGVLTLFVFTIAIGYSLHIKTALKERCGRWWWIRPTLASLIGATAGIMLSTYCY